MADNFSIHAGVEGLDQLIAKTNPQILQQPMRRFFDRSSERVKTNAKGNAPVDQGRLRSSITHNVDPRPLPLWARIGTNVNYAKPVEFGTGLLSDAPDSKRRRYFPPPEALDRWAQLHGFGENAGRVVAYIIWLRGGTRPVRFLRDGFADALNDIKNYLADAATDVGRKWKI